ncbi:twin-arginine translocation pathway signal [Actibacterium mucosum KCTC 23349]|uniref:Twin-arginine translocation pathway signal n=1 Tax=Actibacterium mucosum KCTC 23349 TaxID=1454373 RepID=A0A037ZIB6_9RHOB|nr:DUF1501 domain-containing protein [Actibacterium mucosum]KAJ56190.1 twin-arginine translocation pathway signal [Actibacterium mucosum KCTC 23349]
MAKLLSRRFVLGALGCSAAAAPMLTPVTLAAAPWDTRLVVIILRGAMDGLDVVQPYGDRDFASWRNTLAIGPDNGAQDLDGFFALHGGLSSLMPLWTKGELGFAHAVSTPYRDKRSHFDGQDLLEAGTGFDTGLTGVRDGWLNRMLQAVPGVQAETAFAIGQGEMRVLRGPLPTSSWSPEAQLGLTPAARDLMALVTRNDPLLGGAFNSAIDIAQDLQETLADPETRQGPAHQTLARFAADRLLDETRVAAFSINGWDTHNAQARTINAPLERLSDMILTLKDRLGDVWGKTMVMAMTEFGRTVHENGTGGTDHGTGGAMLMAGGALGGGRVYGAWPGLGHGDLYKGRDLMPTADVRAYAGTAMKGLFGLNRDVIEGAVFPGLDMTGVPQFLA